MVDPVVNKGKVTVSTGYNSTATSIVLATGQGAELPDPVVDGAYNLPWWDSTNYNDPADDPNFEIVRVTGPAGTGDTKTIVRAQEGTAATNKNNADATYKMHLGVTAKTITDLIADVEKAATVIVGKSGHVDYLTTDYGSDSACIQAAYTYLNGLGGGKMLIREGTYSLPAEMTPYSNIHLCGVGAEQTIFQKDTDSGANNFVLFKTGTGISINNLEISGIHFKGEYPTYADNDNLIELDGTNTNIFIHDCKFSNTLVFAVSIGSATTQDSKDVRIENNYFYDCRAGVGYTGQFANVQGNIFRKTFASASGEAIDLQGSTETVNGEAGSFSVIADNVIIGYDDEAIDTAGTTHTTITGNYIFGDATGSSTSSDIRGIICGSYCTCVGNIIEDVHRGIYCPSATHVTIANNVIRGFTLKGIELDTTSHSVISGNIVEGDGLTTTGSARAINLSSVNNVIIQGNYIRDCAFRIIFTSSSSFLKIENNYIECNTNTDYAIYGNGLTNCSIQNNTINGANLGTDGLVLNGANININITGNIIFDCTGDGISIQTAASTTLIDSIISNNILEDNGAAGIDIYITGGGGIQRVNISGNMSSGNGVEGYRLNIATDIIISNNQAYGNANKGFFLNSAGNTGLLLGNYGNGNSVASTIGTSHSAGVFEIANNIFD